MSEENKEPQIEAAQAEGLMLDGIYAFKKGMSSIYGEDGEAIPVTVLQYEPWIVSQIKTVATDGYDALQLACRPQKAKNSSKASSGHLSGAGFENGAKLIREIRQAIPEGIKVGDRVSLESLKKGDRVKMTSSSKGRGFAGVIKRWGFAGGPAAHGSKFHRQPGSIGNRTWPGRVMAGRKLPGHFGDETVSIKNVKIVDVLTDDNVVLVKGPVPGATNSIVRLMKV